MAVTFHAHVLEKQQGDNNSYTQAKTVEHNGRSYVVACPGTQFKVQAQIKNLPSKGYYRVSLNVDGNPVGYSQTVIASSDVSEIVFHGWYAGSGRYTDFLFSSTQSTVKEGTAGTAGCASNSMVDLGSIEVNFFEQVKQQCGRLQGSRKRGRYRQDFCHQCEKHKKWFYGEGVLHSKGGGGEAGQTPGGEDKKFFVKPSVKASSSGNVCNFISLRKPLHLAPRAGSVPVVIKFQCETAQTLSLRGILPPLAMAPFPPPAAPRSFADNAARHMPVKAEVKKEARPERLGALSSEHGGTVVVRDASAVPRSPTSVHAAGQSARSAIVILDTSDRFALGEGKDSSKPITIGDESDEESHGGGALGGRCSRRRACTLGRSENGCPSLWMWEEEAEIETVNLD